MLEAEPSPIARSWWTSVRTVWKGGTRSTSEWHRQAEGDGQPGSAPSLAADTPPQLLGSDSAPSPQDLLISAFNSCIVASYVLVCTARGVALEELEVQTKGSLDLLGILGADPDAKPGYESVAYTVRVRGHATPAQFRAIHQIVTSTSPVFAAFANPTQMSGKLVVEE
jgi:uncharacterized OsmC-like protein